MSVFTDLTDVPNSYSGEANKYAKVNAGETAIIFCDPSTDHAHTFLSLTDTPANYTDDAKKIVRVNDAETDLQFGGDVLFGNNEKVISELVGGGTVDVLFVDGGNNTVLNTESGEKILFKVGGSQVGQFRETGKFGIGVSPSYHLDIYGVSEEADIRVRSDSDNANLVLDCASGYNDYIYFKEAGAQTWRLGADLGGSEFFELYSYDGAGQMLKVVDGGGSPSFTFNNIVCINEKLEIDVAANDITLKGQNGYNDVTIETNDGGAGVIIAEDIDGEKGIVDFYWTNYPDLVTMRLDPSGFATDVKFYSSADLEIESAGHITMNPGGSCYIILESIKATTGDPAGVEGMIYFNTYDEKMRVYIDGQWRDIFTW